MRRLIYLSLAVIVCVQLSCQPKPEATTDLAFHPAGPAWAALFQRQAAEYKALCAQAYNVATFRLNEKVKAASKLPQAIITDIDETVLDNSPYFIREAKKGLGYNDSTWINWTAERKCDTLTGAVRFLKLAKAKGVTIFYVTNRFAEERDATMDNLRKFGLPDVDTAHLFLAGDGSSKESRRKRITTNYEVILLLGDNLGDFHHDFDARNAQRRKASATKHSADFGDRFIVFPNLMYGAWEDVLYPKDVTTNLQKNKTLQQLN